MAGTGAEITRLTAGQFARVEELFFKLQQLPADQRAAILDAECADDPKVRAEVESLLLMGTKGPSTAPLHGQFDRTVLEREVADVKALIGQPLGQYRVIDLLGRGGMGMVLLARDTRLERLVAIKILPPSLKGDPLRLARFLREARILASLSHPNIATVYGLEEHAGITILVMEYIEGQTLSARLARKRLSIEETLQVGRQIAAGIECAHNAGVIHRDLKPGNVMFAADNRVKVLDFGLARETGPSTHDDPTRVVEQADSTAVTKKGSIFGTPAYMSPEQIRGKPMDHRSDVFSFGCILYKCLTGESAFDGASDADVIAGIIEREPNWSRLPKQLPPCIRRLVQRCMAKDPDQRMRDMGDIVLELDDALEAREWLTPRVQADRQPARWMQWLPWVAVAVSLALMLGVLLWRQSASAPETKAAAQPLPARRFDLSFPAHAPQRDMERIQVAVSRDGRTIVAACRTSTGQGLWYRTHADGEWRPIEQTQNAQTPFLSPDGKWVGFYQNSQLMMRPLIGGQSIKLADVTNWYGAFWSDDNSIYYAPAWGGPIFRIPEPGSSGSIVTAFDPPKGEASHVYPYVLPGGRWLLYSVWTGGEEAEIHATDLQTRQEHVVVRNGTTPRYASTPRGDYLLFERAGMIFAAPFDPQRAAVTGLEVAISDSVMMDGTRYAAYFDVAADGTIAYIPGYAFAEESRLAYVSEDGQSTIPLNDDRRSFGEPVFNRDGTKLFVVLKGKLYRGYIYDLQRQTTEHLVTGGDVVGAAFSPDDKTIALSHMRDGRYGLYLFSLADRRLEKLVDGGVDYPSFLSWSPDGKWLVYGLSEAQGVPRDLWMIEPRVGAQPRKLVGSAGMDQYSSFSVDGQWIAYSSDVTGRLEVHLVSIPDGARQRQVSFGGGSWPTFGPDGKSLYYVSPQGLVKVGIAADGTVTSRPEVVYDKPFGQSDPLAKDYTIAPDGRILLVEPSERRPSVEAMRVIANWHSLLPAAGR